MDKGKRESANVIARNAVEPYRAGCTGAVSTAEKGNAHISVETDGGKESGSMDNIYAGTFVTVTLNGKGKVTYVLVSSQTGFGGIRRPTN